MVDLVGSGASETLSGGDADDSVLGNGGNDLIVGAAGTDSLFGGAGDDTVDGGAGSDIVDGGSGNDQLDGDRETAVTSFDVTTTTTNDPLTISLTIADESNAVFEDVTGFVSRDGAVSSDLNIAFVIDVSGSMTSAFDGSTVGDVNGDGSSDTLLDAVIASFIRLNESLIDSGLGDANIAIVPFASASDVVFVGRADQDNDQNGVRDIDQVLTALRAGGTTRFDLGLEQAAAFLTGAGSGDNQVFFISDGFPDGVDFSDESLTLRDPAGLDASIRAIGLGNGASLADLDLVDDGAANNSVERVLDPAALDAGLSDTGVPLAEIDRVEIFVNGVLQTTVDAAQLQETPFGLRFSATAAGLSPAFDDEVSARVVAVDGTTVTTTQVVEVAATNAAGDDTLIGGQGNDTLDGNGGVDTVDYSTGGNGLIEAGNLNLQPISASFLVLTDGAGFQWDFSGDLTVVDGTSDAFDTGVRLNILEGTNRRAFLPDGALQQSEDGRTLVATDNSSTIAAQRQVFVPDDASFARYLETFTNQGSTTTTFSVEIRTNLGSDLGTSLITQSPATQGFNPGDRFALTDDPVPGGGDPFILQYFGDGTGALRPRVGLTGSDETFYTFDITLAPGETTSILHFAAQSQDINSLGQLLLALDEGAVGQLQALTADEIDRIGNFDIDPTTINSAPVVVDLESGRAQDQFGDVDALSSIENVIGTDANDSLAGDGGQNRIEGLAGNDHIFGRGDDDLLEGGAGNDILIGDGNGNVTTDDTVTTIAGDPLTISLTAPDASNETTIAVSGFVSGDVVVGEDVNIAYVIDVSGSMSGPFAGANVGDQDGNGTSDTLLDAVIASFISLNQSLIDAGLEDANIAVIPFSDDAAITAVSQAGFDSDLDGRTDIEEALRDLNLGNLTFFDAGLASAIDFFNASGNGANHVFFISDGQPNGGPFADESAVLRDPDGINATIRGIGLGAGADLAQIDLLDDGLANNSAERVTDPALLDANLQDSDVDSADIARVELLLDGVLVQTIVATDLISTPVGLRFSADISGLDPNLADGITARVVAQDGTVASTSQIVGVLAGDATGDDTLLGGEGADTLGGNGGDDIIVGGGGADVADGGDGRDEIFGGADGDLLLGGAGGDRIDGDGNLAATSSDTATTITTNEPLTISMTVADRSDAGSELLTGFVSRDQVVNDDLNIAFVLDRSGSMTDSFQGTAVGDVNGDGRANTILDAVIVGVGSLNASLVDAGLGSANVAIIPFDDDAQIIGNTRADADSNGDGITDVETVLAGIQSGGATHFDEALSEAITFFGSVGSGANHVFFLSDGLPNGGPFNDESEILRDPDGIDATIRAISLRSGISLLDLDLLDDGLANNTVELAVDPLALDANLQDAGVEAGDIDRVEISVNGVLQTTIPATELVSTPFGLRFSTQINGLVVLADDVVEATLIAADGTSVTTAQTIEVDGGAGAGADLISGGDGDDTLNGNGGDDTVQGNADQDLLSGNAGDDSLSGNDGNDTLIGGAGDDTLDGGTGADTADFSGSGSGVTVDLSAGLATGEGADVLLSIEKVIGTAFDDAITGGDADEVLSGGSGDDTVAGGFGADNLSGGDGTDTAVVDFNSAVMEITFLANREGLRVGFFDDDNPIDPSADATATLDASFEILTFPDISFDILIGSGTAEGIATGDGNDLIGALGGNDVVDAGQGRNHVFAGEGADLVTTGAGDDTLRGEDGADTLLGGDGSDELFGGDGADLHVVTAGIGIDAIRDFVIGDDRVDLSDFEIFDLDDVVAIASDEVIVAVDGSPDFTVRLDLGVGQTLDIDRIDAGSLTADMFIFAERPPGDFNAARNLVVDDGDWRYTGRTVDRAFGDDTDYAAQDWSSPTVTQLHVGSARTPLIGDVTGDGTSELVVVTGNAVRILDAAGVVIATTAFAFPPGEMILEDLNGDGVLEILVGSRGTTNLEISILDGDASVLQTISGPSGGSDANNLQMAPVAYLGEGKLAVLFRAGFDRDPRGLAIYDLNTGDEQFLFDTGPEPNSVSVGSVFNDGILDFALNIFTPGNGATGTGVAGGGTTTFDNRSAVIIVDENGNETLVDDFVPFTGGTTTGSVDQVIVDLDGDGLVERVVSGGHTAQRPGLTEIQIQDQTGQVLHSTTTLSDVPARILVSDVDGDGDMEIAISHGNGDDIRLFDHDLGLIASRTGVGFNAFAITDMDGDGRQEIVVGTGSEIRFLSSQDLSDVGSPFEAGGSVSNVLTTDLDNDGRADVVATTGSGIVLIQGDAPVSTLPEIQIAPSSPGAIAATGDSFTFSTVYTNDAGDEATTGLGLRIHFDSSILTYDQASNVFARSLQPFGQVPEVDTLDFDNDVSTDTFVAFNWADLGGDWPGPGNLPQSLLESTFTVSGPVNDTAINYSVSSVPNGFDFTATPFRILADTFVLPDDLSIAEGSAAGTVLATISPSQVDPNDPGTFTLVDDGGGRFVLNGLSLEVANGDLIDFEAATSHDITIRIEANNGATVDRILTVAVEDVSEQIVTPVIGGAIAGIGDVITVSAEYTTSDPIDPALSGLGLRVHFDSSVLTFGGFDNLFQTALQPFGQVIEDDVDDFDGDADTDTFVAVNWADLNQSFPGSDVQVLYDALFTSVNGQDTVVNFTASSTASGRTFTSQSFDVIGDRWPLPDAVAVAENSADGAQVADLSVGLTLDPDDPGIFSLLDDAAGRFELDGFILRVADGGNLDFEDAASHDLSLRITSNTGAVADRALTVDLTNVNEAPTAVSLNATTVAEDAAANTVVGQLIGEDPDGEGVIFALLDDAGGRFALSGDSIVVAGDGVLDFETAQSHQILVEAIDSQGLSFADLLTIDVTDVAEATLDLDGDGAQNALSDGLIALGRMFGAPVEQLSGFAVPGSPGADPAELAVRLQEAESGFFDVDGDGVQNALSDGLIILGHLFGAPASQLAGFANPDGLRTSPEDIGSFLDAVDINFALADVADSAAAANVL
ncbi:MAG: VWA domain-containing protein [Minwuia sp.]|nr:VWA domain-containing protein [Minwuia sp.]